MKPVKNLSDWSFNRLAMVWVVGTALEMALILIPAAFVPDQFKTVPPARTGSLRVDDKARRPKPEDAKLRRASRPAYVSAAGDSIYRMIPVGRADSAALGLRSGAPNRFIVILLLFMFGSIPAGLLIITAVWSFAQLMKRFMPSVLSPESPTAQP
jgi:hypothetical protein